MDLQIDLIFRENILPLFKIREEKQQGREVFFVDFKSRPLAVFHTWERAFAFQASFQGAMLDAVEITFNEANRRISKLSNT